MLEDFVKVADMPRDTIEKYRDTVPDELVEIWEKQGLGIFLDGYLKLINPDDYIEFVKETFFDGDNEIPIGISAFGDVITWHKGAYVAILEYKCEDVDILIKNFKHFLMVLNDDYFLGKKFEIPLYKKAIEKFGPLEYDECFGFVPILPLGGKKDVEHMDKVKVREHLYLLVQFTGGIFD